MWCKFCEIRQRKPRTALLLLLMLTVTWMLIGPDTSNLLFHSKTDRFDPLLRPKDLLYKLPHSSTEVRRIAFLKVYKAASSTVQNIFFRFGLERNLSLVLPKGTHILSKSKANYRAVYPPLDNIKHDILCSHVVYNRTKFESLLHDDAVYIGIVREPLSRFVSAALYHRNVWHVRYLTKIPSESLISDLIRYPERLEDNPLRKSCTYNRMAQDFGFEMDNVTDLPDEVIDTFINGIAKQFQLVLVVELFDQSLVLMKRVLGWSFRDILYLKNNAYKGKQAERLVISDEEKDIFRKRDHIEYRMYDYFLKRIQRQIEAEGVTFADEVMAFQNVLKTVQQFCLSKDDEQTEIPIPSSDWNEGFTVTKTMCGHMLRNEIPFNGQLQKRHRELLDTRPVPN